MLNSYTPPSTSYRESDQYKAIISSETPLETRNHLFYTQIAETGLNIFAALLVEGDNEAADKLISLGYDVNRLNKFGENSFFMFANSKIEIPANKILAIALYLESKGVNVHQRNLLGVSGKDMLFLGYGVAIGRKEEYWQQDGTIRKVLGFEYPTLVQMTFLGKMLRYRTFEEVRSSRIWQGAITGDGVIINARDYLFGFVKTAQYGLVSRLLDYIKWYEESQPDGDVKVLLDLQCEKNSLISYALKVRSDGQQIVALLLQCGASPIVMDNGVQKEVELQTMSPNPVFGLSRFNIVNAEAGLGPRNWAQYVLVCREAGTNQQRSPQGL